MVYCDVGDESGVVGCVDFDVDYIWIGCLCVYGYVLV